MKNDFHKSTIYFLGIVFDFVNLSGQFEILILQIISEVGTHQRVKFLPDVFVKGPFDFGY